MPLLSELLIRDTLQTELPQIAGMEQGPAREFILPYSLDRHTSEFKRRDVMYKSIVHDYELVGFIILVLDADLISVELRRVVVVEPGKGYGKQAVKWVDLMCRDELQRRRVWLDVFATNERARHVYAECGYRQFGEFHRGGKALLLYEMSLGPSCC